MVKGGGIDELERLRHLAGTDNVQARISVDATVGVQQTRNLIGTLPGNTPERIVLVTHTDGNTWVQDNGVAALLTLARYFASLPLHMRTRTIEFAFTSAHRHMSREGSARYAAQLDPQFDDGSIAFVFPVEHLGTREVVRRDRAGQPGRQFEFTGRNEPMLWAVGPSPALRDAVISAVQRRGLDRVIITAGIGIPDHDRVPAINSFGGLGTIYNMHLLPTTAIISGPWSLWAPAFGADAIDIERLREQVLAIGDVVAALDTVPEEQIAGKYLSDRLDRANGKPNWIEPRPPERA